MYIQRKVIDVEINESDNFNSEISYYKKQLDLLTGLNIRSDIRLSVYQRELKQKREAFAILSELQKTFTIIESLSYIYSTTVKSINKTLAMDKSILLTANSKTGNYQIVESIGLSTALKKQTKQINFNFPEELFMEKNYILVNKSTISTEFIENIRSNLELPYFICIPIIVEDKFNGILISGRIREQKPFFQPLDNGDVDTLKSISNLISNAIYNRVAAEELLKLNTAKNYFLGLLSHELNTPLIGINGNAKFILEISEDSDIKDCASYILESEARLRKFAELSLLITRIQTDTYHKSRSKECLQNIIEESLFNFQQILAEKKVLIKIDLPADLFYISVDISLITKVFNIVIGNAIQFSPENSTIVIAGDIILSTSFALKIIDSGTGFSELSLENLFQIFSSTDDLMAHSEGTGLSLAAAKVIMEFHGFEISACNSPDGGAEIQMIFK